MMHHSLYILQSRLIPIPWSGTLCDDSFATALVLTPNLWSLWRGPIFRVLGSRLASAISWSTVMPCLLLTPLLPLPTAAALVTQGAVSLYIPASSCDESECKECGKPLALTLVVEDPVMKSDLACWVSSTCAVDTPVICSIRVRLLSDNFDENTR